MGELYIDSVCKTFGTRQVLTDIFISCRPGEIIGLLGRNGSGKSTLLQIIFGSLSAEYRYVTVDGKIVPGPRQTNEQIAYLPQHNFLPGHLRIGRIIKLFCDVHNRDAVESHPNVQPFLELKPNQLSGGERRLIEIMLIVNSGSTYILLDEPLNAIEPIHKEVVKQIIQEHAFAKGFIITDHDYKNVLSLATKTILLVDGCTREIKTAEELVRFDYL